MKAVFIILTSRFYYLSNLEILILGNLICSTIALYMLLLPRIFKIRRVILYEQ